ncbi:DotA/TraY family protein (plasmid) [Chimaeribacter arupi]|uniref:DotA/TraY family protein n=2 Tax=Enterobacterales TaxID=91347 RepID=UPI0027121A8B|nr:DotA/TraY family protein [Chimaeribacter arupi]WKZ94980.1 DotA/TraY family protein [Chimaeribacter arupi]
MNEKIRKRKKIFNNIIIVLLLNMLFINLAYAGEFGNPMADSYATKYGLPLFHADTSPFSTVLFVFNSATMVVAGLIFIYNCVIGTVSTAHDGQMLGKKWSSMMMPIRLSLAVAFMMPVAGENGGFSAVQKIIYEAGRQGSGVADAIWAAYVPTALNGNSYIPPETSEKIKELLKNTVQSSVCVAQANKTINKSITSTTSKLFPDYRQMNASTSFGYKSFTKAENDGRRIVGYNWGRLTAPNNIFPPFTSDACGTTQLVFDIPNFDPDTNKTTLVDLRKISEAMQNIQIKQMDELVKEADVIGKRIVNENNYTKDDALADMTRLSEKYSTALKEAAKEQFAKVSLTNGVIMAQKDGWMGAGSWALRINDTVSSANSIVNNIPTSQFGSIDRNNLFIRNFDASIFVKTGAAAAIFDSALRQDPDSPKSRTGSNDAYSMQLMNMFVSNDKDLNNVKVDYFSANPMVVFSSMGSRFLDIANGAAITATTASIVSAIPFFGNVLTTIAAAFGTAFSMMFWAVVVPGLYLSYYVQMIPFFMFTTAVVMWFVLMAEALFASQLWVMMFLTATGDDFVGEQKPGLSLLFSLYMRPALYVLGLIIAITISYPVFGFINREYINLLANAPNGDHYLWSQIGYGFGYIMIVHTIMMKIWQLPLELPENIESWMNIRGSGSVASLKGAAQETMSGTNAISKGALPAAAGTLTAGSKILEDVRSGTKQKQIAELQARARANANTSSAGNGGDQPSNNQVSPKPTDGGQDISSFTSDK